jgi:predicted amidohydrolase
VAVAQVAVDPLSRAANQRRAHEIIGAAANLNPIPDVLCLPALCDGGLPEAAMRPLTAAMTDTFVEVLALRAREMGLALVFGYCENDGRHLYDTAAWCDADGDLLHKQRRITLRGREPEFLARGSSLAAVPTLFGTLGLLVGEDAWNPSLSTALQAMGSTVLFLLFCGGGVGQHHSELQETARRSGLWLVAVNAAGADGRGGGSTVIDPSGRPLAAFGMAEELACVEVDLGKG